MPTRQRIIVLLAALTAFAFLTIAMARYPIFRSREPDRTNETQRDLREASSSRGSSIQSRVSDLPDLYPGTQWTAPKSGEYPFVTQIGEGKILDGFGLESTALVDSPNDFLEYYRRELARGGWAFLEEASGPEGEVYDYAKGEALFMYRYKEITEGEGLARHVVGYKLFLQYH